MNFIVITSIIDDIKEIQLDFVKYIFITVTRRFHIPKITKFAFDIRACNEILKLKLIDFNFYIHKRRIKLR